MSAHRPVYRSSSRGTLSGTGWSILLNTPILVADASGMTCKTSQCSTIFAVLVEPEHVDPGVVMLTRPDLVTVQHDVVALGQGALDLIAPSITARLSQPSRTHASGRRELNPSHGSSVFACSSAGTSLRSPSRASASPWGVHDVVYAPPSCLTATLPIISGRKAGHVSESSAMSCLAPSRSVPRICPHDLLARPMLGDPPVLWDCAVTGWIGSPPLRTG